SEYAHVTHVHSSSQTATTVQIVPLTNAAVIAPLSASISRSACSGAAASEHEEVWTRPRTPWRGMKEYTSALSRVTSPPYAPAGKAATPQEPRDGPHTRASPRTEPLQQSVAQSESLLQAVGAVEQDAAGAQKDGPASPDRQHPLEQSLASLQDWTQ